MSNYIERTDYDARIRGKRLDQLTNNTPAILDNAEETAIQVVSDALHVLYDTDAIFAKRTTARDKQVVRWVCTLTMYFIYERLPDTLIPEYIVNNYDETMQYLKELEKGLRSTQLPKREDATGKTKTRFRWGSYKKRSH